MIPAQTPERLLEVTQLVDATGLMVLGGLHPEETDLVPTGCKTLILLGPKDQHFWPIFAKSPEKADGAPDPLDRWSERVVSDLAKKLSAQPVFPFGGPPYAPFYSWALRCGNIFSSPIRLLVHQQMGLYVSFRGALALPWHLDLPQSGPSPCIGCSAPCQSACPVEAFENRAYDVAGCRAHINGPDSSSCRSTGCAARRACPISKNAARPHAQSAFHMKTFAN